VRNRMRGFVVPALGFLLFAGFLAMAYAEQEGGDAAASAGSGPPAAPGAYAKAAENGRLALYVNPATLGIRVEDKANGALWHGTLDETDDRLNQTWQAFFSSGLTVEYMDARGRIRTASALEGQADIAVEPREAGFDAHAAFPGLGITLTMEVRLEDDAVRIRVPEASIAETDEANRLQALHLYPFFGATRGVQAERGYMLIPDGSGALIALDEPTLATQPYTARVYGDDFGMKGSPDYTNDLAYTPEQIYLPVFGIARREGADAFAALIDGGAPYAEIRAYPSGVTTVYNWTAARWIYREEYFQPVDKKGRGVRLNQKERNRFDAGLTLMFLAGDDADYSGMAARVRRELVRRGELPEARADAGRAPPLRVEFLAAEQERRMIGSRIIPMTTLRQMDAILEDLRAAGAERLLAVVRGYTKGGAGNAPPTHFPFEEAVGGEDEWRRFLEKYGALGIPVHFYADYVLAAQGADGYGREDVAQTVSRQLLSYYGAAYFLQPEVTRKLFEREIVLFEKAGAANVALDSVGSFLFSAHERGASARAESLETYRAMLENAPPGELALYRPNHYLWRFGGRALDIPMASSRFLLETKDVPFLQLVLKGHIDYYAPPSNFNANPREDLLRMIDYGAYPSFIVTAEDPIRLLKTASSWLFTSQYEVWREQILGDYRAALDALLPAAGAAYEKREEIAEGVFRSRYSNGTVVYVNYNRREAQADGRTVPALGYLVLEGGRP